jgi:hypothetical protein
MNTNINIRSPVAVSNSRVTASVITHAEHYQVAERSIVLNIGKQPVSVKQSPQKTLAPLHSSIYDTAVIEEAERVLILSVAEKINLGGIVNEPGWLHYWQYLVDTLGPEEAAATGFPQTTPLWKSPQIDIGTICVSKSYFSGNHSELSDDHEYQIKVNLWFSTQNTDCSIHNIHNFIEIHTQITGIGRMQKFRTNDKATLYEDIIMGMGYTTPIPFCSVEIDKQYSYPWHQYHADTDCIWLATEFHRAES